MKRCERCLWVELCAGEEHCEFFYPTKDDKLIEAEYEEIVKDFLSDWDEYIAEY